MFKVGCTSSSVPAVITAPTAAICSGPIPQHPPTTAIYTSLGDDYKARMVTRALARIYGGNDADNR